MSLSTSAVVVTAGPAQADVTICEQYGSTTIQGRYVVQNNRWGTSATQCINVTSAGFQITQQQGSAPTNGAPLSYPSVFLGCHYTNCSPGSTLPMQVSRIRSATSSINYRYTGGTYNASYDIWLDPTPKTNGVNQMEIMIWFNRQGSIQPIGSVVGNASVGGRTWQVWRGSNGANNVISYVAPSADHIVVVQRPRLHQRHHRPRRDQQLVVPDQHPGRVRAVERRRRPGGRQLLGVGQRMTASAAAFT